MAIVEPRHRPFTGVEFAVTHSEPPTVFIIQKRERLSPDEGTAIPNPREVVDQTSTMEGVPPETTVERARSASMAATPAPPTRRSSTPRVIQSPDPGKGPPGAPGVPQKKKKKRECLSQDGFRCSVPCLTRALVRLQVQILLAVLLRQVRHRSLLPDRMVVVTLKSNLGVGSDRTPRTSRSWFLFLFFLSSLFSAALG